MTTNRVPRTFERGASNARAAMGLGSAAKLVSADKPRWLTLYEVMCRAREIDNAKAELVLQGRAFFHIPGNGHEGSAVLDLHLIAEDWLHLHYRDKALMVARGVSSEAFIHSVLSSDRSHSLGRQMSGMFSCKRLRILSTPTLVGNGALQAVGVAAELAREAPEAIVVCSMGDGATQQGEVLEAISEAVRSRLPILFFIEDNGLSISTRTAGRTFFSLPNEAAAGSTFLGLPIHYIDGRNVVSADRPLGAVVRDIRHKRAPAIVVFRVERLANHTNADDQRAYRGADELLNVCENGDPIRNLRRFLVDNGTPPDELTRIEAQICQEVRQAADRALIAGQPPPTATAKRPLPQPAATSRVEYRGENGGPRFTMLEAVRAVLRARLHADSRVSLYGQDIEDPKGDVFGVTRGLSAQFPGRVANAPLSESTIIGTCIGRALAGAKPVAFIQFADFLPLAFNQIMSELGSLFWRTVGDWEAPVIVMAPCGGYRPGLGPFHSQTFEALLAHVPGIDVVMPSTAADAAGLLNAAFDSGRPTVFLYPKCCLNDQQTTTSHNVEEQFVPLGTARRLTTGDDVTIVSWGNTVRICATAVEALERAGVSADLFDLRSISPWDRRAVTDSVARTRQLLVVHEDSITCGFGAEVIAAITEDAPGPLAVRRVARPDTYVPFNFTSQLEILPSFRRIVAVAARMLGLELDWKRAPAPGSGIFTIEAIGSSPADQSVTIVQWRVKAGEVISANRVLAELEGNKAVFDITSPVDGIVDELLVSAGQTVPIHSPILRMRTGQAPSGRQLSREEPAEPVFRRRTAQPGPRPCGQSAVTVGMSDVCATAGSKAKTNGEIADFFPGRSADDIMRRTGIASRRYIDGKESALTMATAVARKMLDQENLALADISCIICSTTTPPAVVPSLACRLHGALNDAASPTAIPCFDVSAACTGYLYALSAGFDFLQSRPDGRVLIVTAEVLSQVTDQNDFDTCILFGDAASATILYGSAVDDGCVNRLRRPVVSASGEDGSSLCVPNPGSGFLRMNGKKVFAEAIRRMSECLRQACLEARVDIQDLDFIVPHQANGRIIDAIGSRLGVSQNRIVNQIREVGNTSSSSIPLCLESVLPSITTKATIGLCAFGGGFTYGSAIVERVKRLE